MEQKTSKDNNNFSEVTKMSEKKKDNIDLLIENLLTRKSNKEPIKDPICIEEDTKDDDYVPVKATK